MCSDRGRRRKYPHMQEVPGSSPDASTKNSLQLLPERRLSRSVRDKTTESGRCLYCGCFDLSCERRAAVTSSTLAMSSPSALIEISKRSCIVASSAVKLRTRQQYSSDIPLGSLK